MGGLIDEYLARYVDGKLKRPEAIRTKLDGYIRSAIGLTKVENIKPLHIDLIIHPIAETGKKCTSNEVLRWLKRIFDYAVTRHYIEINPAPAFKTADAGGERVNGKIQLLGS